MAAQRILGLLDIDSDTGLVSAPNIKFPAPAVPIANAYTLDRYEESTFTPNLSIGGSSTGITYSSRSARTTQIGDMVLLTINMVLTSKGSLTGGVTVTGLTTAAAMSSSIPSVIGGMAAGIGSGEIVGIIFATSTAINLYKRVSGGLVQLAETDLTNTMDFYITGVYHR